VLRIGQLQVRWGVQWGGESDWWSSLGLVDSIENSVSGIVHWLERRRGERRRRGRPRGKPLAVQDQLPQLWNGNPLSRVILKDALQDGIQLSRQWKNGPQELGILHVGPESGILERGTLPWVTATCEVHENDSQRPHIIRSRCVAGIGLG